MRELLTQQTVNLLKVRAFILKKAREYLDKQGFFEVQGPILVPVSAGSSNSFEVKYYDSKVCLTKGLLPYGKIFAESLGKVYSISPSFRKEKCDNRHLTEYWRIEIVLKCNLEDIMNLQEQLVSFLCNSLTEIKETLKSFNRLDQDFVNTDSHYARITYDEVLEILQKDGFQVFWGQELNGELQKHLSLKLSQPFFIWKRPFTADTFFCKGDTEKPELSRSADLFAPEGYGEVASSIELLNGAKLQSRLEQAHISKDKQEWLLKFYEDNSIQYSSFAMGIERLLQWICKLEKIEQTTPLTSIKHH